MTCGGHQYLVNLVTNVVTDVTFAGTTSRMAGFIDGIFVSIDPVTSTLYRSAINDGTVWDPAVNGQFQRAANTDPWVGLFAKPPYIYLLGERTSDIFFNSGASPFPFAPIMGVQLPGTEAPFSAAWMGGLIWLAQNEKGSRIVVRANGYGFVKISDLGVDYALSQYDDVSDAVGWTYQEQGQEFYVLKLNKANATWAFDGTGWHQRGTFNNTLVDYDAEHQFCHAYQFGQHLVGDQNSTLLYRQSDSLFFDASGVPLRRERRPPALQIEQQRLVIKSFQLYVEHGVGLATGQGSDPTMILRQSRDAGRTWGNPRPKSIGKQGETKKRVIWRRCGWARDWQPALIFSDPVPVRVLGAFLELRGGQ